MGLELTTKSSWVNENGYDLKYQPRVRDAGSNNTQDYYHLWQTNRAVRFATTGIANDRPTLEAGFIRQDAFSGLSWSLSFRYLIKKENENTNQVFMEAVVVPLKHSLYSYARYSELGHAGRLEFLISRRIRCGKKISSQVTMSGVSFRGNKKKKYF